ncbi:MAG TPA: hypothetical protein VE993_01590 [Stellaceae bacterium]|nr:hypothetical protein [Stellaceae bacterium]
MRLPVYAAEGGGGGGAESGATTGGGGPGAGGGGDPFYQPFKDKIKPETLQWLDGKKFPSLEAALDSGALSDRMARDRNVVAKPDLAKLGEWEGLSVFGYDPDVGKYGAKIKPPAQPNNGKHDEGLFDAFVKSAHKRFVPPAMAEGLMQDLSDFVNARLSETASQGQKAVAELEATMRKEFGQDYEAKKELAVRAFRALGIGADDASEIEKVIGSPRLMKLGITLGEKLGEGNLVASDGTGGAPASPAAAEAELRRLEGDDAFMKIFMDRRHPQNADYKARWQKLADLAARNPNNINRPGRR